MTKECKDMYQPGSQEDEWIITNATSVKHYFEVKFDDFEMEYRECKHCKGKLYPTDKYC